MTGEITLSGPRAAGRRHSREGAGRRRYGIKTFVLPQLNEPDLAELPEEVRRDMTFVPVRRSRKCSPSRSPAGRADRRQRRYGRWRHQRRGRRTPADTA
jgi:hypothetical protein